MSKLICYREHLIYGNRLIRKLDSTAEPNPGKIDLTQKHQAHPENSEIPTLTQLSEPQKFSELTQIPGWATYYVVGERYIFLKIWNDT